MIIVFINRKRAPQRVTPNCASNEAEATAVELEDGRGGLESIIGPTPWTPIASR